MRYFHTMACTRKRINHIEKITSEGGNFIDPISIKEEVVKHFENLYKEKVVVKLVDMDWQLNKLKSPHACWKDLLRKRKSKKQFKVAMGIKH